MDYSKHGNILETSSDEALSQIYKDNTNTTSVRRSYECSFCKRGFTNAQALGGHMNIHRKDKAKAKPKGTDHTDQTNNSKSFTSSPLKHSSDYEYLNTSTYLVPISNEQAHYRYYFPMPMPNFPHHYPYYISDSNNEHVASFQNLKPKQEILEANLSLEIGSSHMEDSKGKSADEVNDNIEHELDLELRLGHPLS